ncbi:hypothetical protein [Oceaniglobus ichthyenteri]|uniref:hypothetical protein n=1 Tax=Oceaniglobus ichthyenteri TaxID=2136177 RepID=UPI000D347B41|nr:hypothetical protein [Oceaniglobus ichthyenteri]
MALAPGQATKEFQIQIDREWAAIMGNVQKAVIYLATEGLAKVQEKSPVDLGTFRANWLISIGEPSDATTMSLSEFAGMNAAALASYAGVDGLPIIYLQNSLPYSLRLENGWSGQAPAGVLAITVAELEAIASNLGSRV